MTTPRTRTRARSHTQPNVEESRNAGQPVSTRTATDHRQSNDTQVFQTNPDTLFARVRITDGVTINMGDYSSYRRDVGLEMDVNLGKPNEDGGLTGQQEQMIDAAYDNAQAWVEDRLKDVIADAKDFFEDVR